MLTSRVLNLLALAFSGDSACPLTHVWPCWQSLGKSGLALCIGWPS